MDEGKVPRALLFRNTWGFHIYHYKMQYVHITISDGNKGNRYQKDEFLKTS